ncbi:MAG: 3-methylcrotonyl-CoA carboxylase [Mesorhizobium amorphae]|nr:MAG: 3-methylcrotonyl-CoA carboxylase [Mesorhizobium amorphae]
MFRSLLIANRGEIACRIVRTARRMGLRTIAVASEADRDALHARLADKTVVIGPSPAAESYLRIDRVLDAARQTGADAIHPGYGFLSENPELADAAVSAGLVFVGPPASAIRAMGLKDAAKRLMEEAGVPVVPGYHGERQETDFLRDEAERIGWPVLIKARAGGGGKGMRRVADPSDFAAALEGARREAKAAFGDGAVLVEKYLASPRHIEIQVFGDAKGEAVHLFERDCSLQRRHQKVIEEAPAPGMTEEMRHAMGEAAVRAAKAVGYQGAGTVEFIADGSEGLRPDRFFFMEMNTRLQVEHPVTEAVTGIDLVEWQLRVAAGEPLPLAQEAIRLTGHAVEARLYAEDPQSGFLPSTGRLAHLSFPETVRVDAGVEAGDPVTPFYDPMVAKLIAHAPDRDTALDSLAQALRSTEVVGPATNREFLFRLLDDGDFRDGRFDTGLIERKLSDLLAPPDSREAGALGALAMLGAFDEPASPDPWDRLRDFRQFGPARRTVRMRLAGEEQAVETAFDSGVWTVGDRTIRVLKRGNKPRVEIDGWAVHLSVIRTGALLTLFVGGRSWQVETLGRKASEAEGAGASSLHAPMPGTVRALFVTAGQTVEKGEPLLVLEAMKMEHTIPAPRAGSVAEVLVAAGERVEARSLLLRLADDAAALDRGAD